MNQFPETTPGWFQRTLGIILLSAPLLGPVFLALVYIYAATESNTQMTGAAGFVFLMYWIFGAFVLYPLAMLGSLLALRRGLRAFFILAFAVCTVLVPSSLFLAENEGLFLAVTVLTAPLCLVAIYKALTCYPKASAAESVSDGEEPSTAEAETTASSSMQ